MQTGEKKILQEIKIDEIESRWYNNPVGRPGGVLSGRRFLFTENAPAAYVPPPRGNILEDYTKGDYPWLRLLAILHKGECCSAWKSP